MLALLDVTVVNIAYNTIAGALGATLDEISWISTAYILTCVNVLPLTGWITQRLGRKRFFMACIAIFTLGSLLCGLAQSVAQLALFRALQGLGGGAMRATSQTILLRAYGDDRRAHALSTYGVYAVVGPMIGPVLGGLILQFWSWPAIFLVNVPFGILALYFAWASVDDRERDGQRDSSVEWVPISLMVVGLVCVQYVLQRGQRLEWFSDAGIVALALLGAFCICAFAWSEWKSRRPTVNIALFSIPSFGLSNVLGLILGLAVVGTGFILPLFLQTVLQYSPLQAAWLLAPSAAATFAAMRLAPSVLSRVSPAIVVAAAPAVVGAIVWAFGDQGGYLTASEFVALRCVQGAATGLWFVALGQLTIRDVRKDQLDSASGLIALVRQIGGAFGIAVIGSILEGSYTVAFRKLLENTGAYSWGTLNFEHAAARGIFVTQGVAPTTAAQLAYNALSTEAQVLAFQYMFWVLGIVLFATALVAIALLALRPLVAHRIHGWKTLRGSALD